jgi:hypothetical protein
MKFIALAVVVSLLGVPSQATAEECAGWTIKALDKQTREPKFWCPDDKDFSFKITGWRKVRCEIRAVIVNTELPDDPMHTRGLICSVKGISVADAASWFPKTGNNISASFTLIDEREGREVLLTAYHR